MGKNLMDLIVISDARFVAGDRELAEELAISVNAVRKRLTLLRSAGLVTQHGGPGRHTTYERSP